MTASPSAQEQISFILKLQRLFSEGEFSATYKFALLLTLAELAVEYGDDSGAALSLPMAKVGEVCRVVLAASPALFLWLG